MEVEVVLLAAEVAAAKSCAASLAALVLKARRRHLGQPRQHFLAFFLPRLPPLSAMGAYQMNQAGYPVASLPQGYLQQPQQVAVLPKACVGVPHLQSPFGEAYADRSLFLFRHQKLLNSPSSPQGRVLLR